MVILVLLNGNCLVLVGLLNWVDLLMILVSLLECVEVIFDGGLFIYGFDVVVGVINFIFKKDMEGGEISVQYGMGYGDYDCIDVFGGFGYSWDSGNLVVVFLYGDCSVMFGKDLDYIKEDLIVQGGVDYCVMGCSFGNILLDNMLYGLLGVDVGNFNYCLSYDNQLYYLEEECYLLFINLNQELVKGLMLDVLVYYLCCDVVDYDLVDVCIFGEIIFDNFYFVVVGDEIVNIVVFSYEDVWGKVGKNLLVYEQW